MIQYLPHINVSLNGLATILLVVGFVLIKQKRESAHRAVMLATLGVNVVFLICYVTYHLNIEGGSKRFPTDPEVASAGVRYFYYGLLLTHVLLAAAVPVLALWTVYLGLAGKRERHRKIAKWTWPIWLYVSVTGVVVYMMLYQIYVPPVVTS